MTHQWVFWPAGIAFHVQDHTRSLSSHCQAIVRWALLKNPVVPGVPTLSLHQLPRVWDKHSLTGQGNNEPVVMQSHFGGPWGASWPHLEFSCLLFLLQSSGGWGTWLGSGGQTVMLKGETHGGMCIHCLRKCPCSLLLWVVYRCTFLLSFLVSKSNLAGDFSEHHTWDRLLPEGRLSLIFQECWLNSVSQSFQVKHPFGGRGGYSCLKALWPHPNSDCSSWYSKFFSWFP